MRANVLRAGSAEAGRAVLRPLCHPPSDSTTHPGSLGANPEKADLVTNNPGETTRSDPTELLEHPKGANASFPNQGVQNAA